MIDATRTPTNTRFGISISIAGIDKNNLTEMNRIKKYAIPFNSGILLISPMINSAIPLIAKIPIIPPIKTMTGLLETASEANTESIEKTISINSIEITTCQK